MAGDFTSRKGLRFPNGIPRAETNREQAVSSVDGSLRYRIAYAIAQADGDMPGMEPDTWDYELADAVIEALGLKQQDRYGFHRCVSEWTPDD